MLGCVGADVQGLVRGKGGGCWACLVLSIGLEKSVLGKGWL
jgi:hypothetical protein